jgi:hypothetical protein
MSWDELNEDLKEFANHTNQRRSANAMEALQRAQAETARLPLCPFCGGRIQVGFELCQHCRNQLGWVQGHPCKPGQQKTLRLQLEEKARNDAIISRRANTGCSLALAPIAGIMGYFALSLSGQEEGGIVFYYLGIFSLVMAVICFFMGLAYAFLR